MEYQVRVERDGRFWVITIPALGGVTQAQFPGEIELMAREWIAVSQGIPIDKVKVRIVNTEDFRPGDRVVLRDPPAGWREVKGAVVLVQGGGGKPTTALVDWDNGECVYESVNGLDLAPNEENNVGQ